jgi:hypothetical protein
MREPSASLTAREAADYCGVTEKTIREVRANSADVSGIVEALCLVEKLQQQNLELAGRVGYLQAELATAREQLLALEDPREDPVVLLERVTAERDSDEREAAGVPEPPRGRWGRLMIWLYG